MRLNKIFSTYKGWKFQMNIHLNFLKKIKASEIANEREAKRTMRKQWVLERDWGSVKLNSKRVPSANNICHKSRFYFEDFSDIYFWFYFYPLTQNVHRSTLFGNQITQSRKKHYHICFYKRSYWKVLRSTKKGLQNKFWFFITVRFWKMATGENISPPIFKSSRH